MILLFQNDKNKHEKSVRTNCDFISLFLLTGIIGRRDIRLETGVCESTREYTSIVYFNTFASKKYIHRFELKNSQVQLKNMTRRSDAQVIIFRKDATSGSVFRRSTREFTRGSCDVRFTRRKRVRKKQVFPKIQRKPKEKPYEPSTDVRTQEAVSCGDPKTLAGETGVLRWRVRGGRSGRSDGPTFQSRCVQH